MGEFQDSPAALADEVLVMGVRCHGLVALESLTELVRAHQPAFDQKIQRTVYCREPYPGPLLPKLAPDSFNRQVILGEKYHPGDEIALAGNRLVMLPKIPAKTFEEGRSLGFIQLGHRPEQPLWRVRRTRFPAALMSVGTRRRSGTGPLRAPGRGRPGDRSPPLESWIRTYPALCPLLQAHSVPCKSGGGHHRSATRPQFPIRVVRGGAVRRSRPRLPRSAAPPAPSPEPIDPSRRYRWRQRLRVGSWYLLPA